MATPDGYYIKDLRIFREEQFKLEDIVIVDNSVYSFAYQIDNGIPIIPFYNDKNDEEMLHLIYYLNCLADSKNVQEQNREAFELTKLANNEKLDNITQKSKSNRNSNIRIQEELELSEDEQDL